MNFMGKKTLKNTDVCNIIRTCKAAEVTELKFGDLHILWGKKALLGNVEDANALAAEEMAEAQKKIEDKELEIQDLENKENLLELLKIEDPAEYERMILSGELENAEGGREA